MNGLEQHKKTSMHGPSKSQINLLKPQYNSATTSPTQPQLKISDLQTSRKIVPSINMSRIKLIPPNKKSAKTNRYKLTPENTQNFAVGPSPGKEVNETIESPEQQYR